MCLLSDQGLSGKQSPNYPQLCLWYQMQLKRSQVERQLIFWIPHLRPEPRGFRSRLCLAFREALCPLTTGRQAPRDSSGTAGRNLASGQEALVRTWVADRNLKV